MDVQHADDGYFRRENFESSLVHSVFNLSAKWHQRLWFNNAGVCGLRVGVGGLGVNSCTIVLLGGTSYLLVQPVYCCSHNAQRHRQTDRQTDDIMMTIADHTAWHDRLKIMEME